MLLTALKFLDYFVGSDFSPIFSSLAALTVIL